MESLLQEIGRCEAALDKKLEAMDAAEVAAFIRMVEATKTKVKNPRLIAALDREAERYAKAIGKKSGADTSELDPRTAELIKGYMKENPQ